MNSRSNGVPFRRVPTLNHLWQRFLLTSSLLVGLAVGVGATVFGYSNLNTVDIHWSVFHIANVPLWAVAIVPVTLTLIAGTLYHWVDGLHHFTEHMRHRHRVKELEAQIAEMRQQIKKLRSDLSHVTAERDEAIGQTQMMAPELDVARDNLLAYEQTVDALQQQVREAEADVEYARRQLADTQEERTVGLREIQALQQRNATLDDELASI